MKTKEQIVRFFKIYGFCDVEEWEKTKGFIVGSGISGVRKPYKSVVMTDYERFVDWYNNGYGAGDMIMYGKSVGIVDSQRGDNVYLCAYFDMNDELIVPDTPYLLKHGNHRFLSPEELSKYQELLLKSSFVLDIEKGVMRKKSLPKMKRFYVIAYGGKQYMGFVKDRTDEGVLTPFLYNDEDFIRKDMWIDMCNVIKEAPRAYSYEMCDRIIEKYSCQWDIVQNDFVFLEKRVARGGRYYYITDKFTVSGAEENFGKLSETRRMAGNYFLSIEDAMDFLKCMKKAHTDIIKNRATNQ